ncbi:MAG TPA: Gfo/Idh/MocA family oxidoreductase [Chloroflexota bacterium]|nr:Gfo/Idh/MocA family oxidoreductase [Chloroflexota bacterium]
MAEKIRVGIVGATVTPGGSGWGANAHVPALKALADRYELKAVCTAHEETARASAEAFGAELAFHDFDAMAASPEIDLISVVVRVPGHKALVDKALRAGKAVFCEWPLGRDLAEAEAMAELARSRGLRTAVGLQARSDPTLTYARELVRDGYVGELLSVRLSSVGQTIAERGIGRIWQGDRRNGANTLTIAAGHAIDALCFVVGEIEELSARLATQITEWRNTETGETMKVDSPDWISVAGRLEGGAAVSFLTATVPFNPSGNRFEVYGREGTLVITGGTLNSGPSQLAGARGREALTPLEPPERLVPAPGAPAGAPRNVAQAYARIAAAWSAGEPYHPDFEHAVRRHTLIEAIERSSAERRAVRVADVRPAAVRAS